MNEISAFFEAARKYHGRYWQCMPLPPGRQAVRHAGDAGGRNHPGAVLRVGHGRAWRGIKERQGDFCPSGPILATMGGEHPCTSVAARARYDRKYRRASFRKEGEPTAPATTQARHGHPLGVSGALTRQMLQLRKRRFQREKKSPRVHSIAKPLVDLGHHATVLRRVGVPAFPARWLAQSHLNGRYAGAADGDDVSAWYAEACG